MNAPRPSPFSPLFCFCVLLSTQTKEQKRGRPENKTMCNLHRTQALSLLLLSIKAWFHPGLIFGSEGVQCSKWKIISHCVASIRSQLPLQTHLLTPLKLGEQCKLMGYARIGIHSDLSLPLSLSSPTQYAKGQALCILQPGQDPSEGAGVTADLLCGACQ